MAVLEAKNISYKYGKGDMVIKNLNLSFEAGRVYALLGASGSGKTTLLSLLAGLDCCVDGSILYNGSDLKTMNRDRYRAKNIGMVFQQFNLLHRFNAVENVVMAMDISKYKVENGKKYAADLLDNLGIDEKKRRRKVIELSGGEQQRVAIARAISHKPKIILADEPTGSLDEINQSGIIEDLVKFAKKDGSCVIISTHSREVAESADEVFTIERL
ncbi:MAG: ABC transporter ATP-binding protein [Oscillospiraceae bacterium]|jgi:putative ABC transport system ATP-binding protein|nr:ABC transporter ATP-binding protein [Oscillospiraceae bacterium]